MTAPAQPSWAPGMFVQKTAAAFQISKGTDEAGETIVVIALAHGTGHTVLAVYEPFARALAHTLLQACTGLVMADTSQLPGGGQ